MGADILSRLADHGIRLRHHKPGEDRAPCPECDRGPKDDALAVRIEGDGSATWICHRCDWRGGIGPERSERHAKPAPARQDKRSDPEQHDTLAPWGERLWQACQPIEPGTPAAAYLERRGCTVPPGDLRWHANLEDKVSGYRGPALVALVTNVETVEPINLHRTWLAPDGTGKAPIAKPRRLLKDHRARGVVRLWPDEDVTLGLVLGEGLETCLAAARAGLTPVWSVLSAGNLAAFPVLPGLEGLTVLVDHDKPNPKTGKRAGHDAARELIARYAAAGFDPDRDIRVILPPTEGQDVNDLEGARHG
jgi:putative DNA primase/helicase